MSLPKTTEKIKFFKNHKLESLIIPVMIGLIFLAVIVAGFLIPKKNQESKQQKDVGVYTKSNKVEVQKGKVIEVAPQVQQISPENLRAALAAKEDIVVVRVFEGEGWREPHIQGSLFVLKSEFELTPNFDREKTYVFVSDDGYESAAAIAKLVQSGFSYDKNLNLEGGLKAWKEKGFELET